MTNMPGSGQEGYGGGWTPPTPGQQPGAGGQWSGYGQPAAPPPTVPPIVPQRPVAGVNGYGYSAGPVPVAAGYGQPAAAGYGQPPAPGRKSRKPLAIAAVIVVVLALAGGVGWKYFGSSGSGPGNAGTAADAVKGYLEALSRGDAAAALTFSNDQPASKDFLTDDILKKQIAKWPITNIRILNDDTSPLNTVTGFSRVHVAVNFGDKSSDTTLSVKKQDGRWGLSHATVKLDTTSGVGNQELPNTLTMFGKPLNGSTVYVFPGFLDVGSSNTNVAVTTKPILLDGLATGGTSAYLAASYEVTDAAKTAILNGVKAVTDTCTNSHLRSPASPCNVVAVGMEDGSVNWPTADLSRVKVASLDSYQGLKVTVMGQADFNGVTGIGHDGQPHPPENYTMYIYGNASLATSPPTVVIR